MKKTFSFNVPKKNRDRQIDAIKYEIKKYIGRERRKELPHSAEFWYWDFDCKIGLNAEEAVKVHMGDINASISEFASDPENETFYLEVLVRAALLKPKPKKKPEDPS